MSMISCECCGDLIDSDDDPDCFISLASIGGLTFEGVRCESCRENECGECETCGKQIEDNGKDFCSYECAAQPVSAN